MKISYSNKTLSSKPQKEWEYGKYFGKKGTSNRIKFTTTECQIKDFESIVSLGHTLSYQCVGDDAMNRKANYIGTDFIIIDIDGTDLTIDEVLDRTTYKPTIIHTTFSNLTERKNFKHCYHLIYCLNETLYGEDNFNYAFSHFSCGIEDLVDSNAKDCHRITFTSNSALPNYEYRLIGNTYSCPTTGGIHNEYSPTIVPSVDNKILSSVKKSNSFSIYNSNNNMNVEERNMTDRGTSFGLDSQFLLNLNRMSRKDFVGYYGTIYDYLTFTPPSVICTTEEGIEYADYRGMEYYELPSHWKTNKSGDREKKKIEIGGRTTQLYIEANTFLLIKPNISKEHLVFEVVRNVWENYDNSDKQFTNYYILSLVENVWNNHDNFIGHPIPRHFKIISYPIGTTKQSCVGIVRKLMKDDSIGSIIDINLSLEENLAELRKVGVKIKKNRLVQFIKDNHLEDYIKSDKQVRESRIMEIVNANPTASLRELAEICKGQNLKVSYETIRKIKERYV